MTRNQRSAATRLLLRDFLSPEIKEAVLRTTFDFGRKPQDIGVDDLVGRLYAYFGSHLAKFFEDELPLKQLHRDLFRQLQSGSAPHQVPLASTAYEINLDEDVVELLWNSARIATSQGRVAGLPDIISAIVFTDKVRTRLKERNLVLRYSIENLERFLTGLIVSGFFILLSGEVVPPLYRFAAPAESHGLLEISITNGVGLSGIPVESADLLLNDKELYFTPPISAEVQVAKAPVELRHENTLRAILRGKEGASVGFDLKQRGP